MSLTGTMSISAAGLSAQSTRLRVIAENLANADSTSTTAGGDPYRRKVITFRSALDQTLGAQTVRVAAIKPSGGNFERRFDPGHQIGRAHV